MKGVNNLFLHFVFVLYVVKTTHSVPPDYCIQPLNTSDCKLTPTPVFSYYKPGSRCEIELWRGCPTANKFETQYHCVNLCIFKAQDRRNYIENDQAQDQRNDKENDVDPAAGLEKVKDDEHVLEANDACDAVLNTDRCGNTEQRVYTHHNGTCVEAFWRGCPTRNKFRTKARCLIACIDSTIHKIEEWIKEKEHKEETLDENNSVEHEEIENNGSYSKENIETLKKPKEHKWEEDLNNLLNSEAEDVNQIVDFISDAEEKHSMKDVTANIFNNETIIEEMRQSSEDQDVEPHATGGDDHKGMDSEDKKHSSEEKHSSGEKHNTDNWTHMKDNSTRGCTCSSVIHDTTTEGASALNKKRIHGGSPLPDVEILRGSKLCDCS